MIEHYFQTPNKDFTLIQGDCCEILSSFNFRFSTIFADPPYFLSNGGFSVQSGKQVSVNKGEWDKSHGAAADAQFNYEWIRACRGKLAPNGTIWISGTAHNICSVMEVLQELDFKVLNFVTWVKTNPPPNLSCRYFTHSAEYIIWARKDKKVPHYYNYDLMRRVNGGKQMRDVWHLPAIGRWEKTCGKHPTQKPLPLLARLIAASTQPGEWILDPFNGSGTTGIAANLLKRKYLGIDMSPEFLEISKLRRMELNNPRIFDDYRSRLNIPRDEVDDELEGFCLTAGESTDDEPF